MREQFQVRFVQVPRWQMLVGAALVVAFAVALAVLTLGLFIIVLPVLVVAGALYYFFGAQRRNGQAGPDPAAIDAEYRVIEPERLERDRGDPRG